MSTTDNPHERRRSIWISFLGVLFGALVATFAFALLSLWISDTEEPLRSAEISLPLPDVDLPPGSLPEVSQQPVQ
jgi:hypothetical protein